MSSQSTESATTGFWESRTGWKSLKAVLLLEPLPGGARWAAAFGSLLLFSFILQVVTGILLTMSYSPSVVSAWPSVRFIQEQMPLGWLIRSLHHWGASAMVILLLAHLIQVFVWGAYKRPRELTWMVGVLLLAVTLTLAFTGYLLPWDEKAYWASKVGLGIVSTIPLIGDQIRTLLQGGDQIGNLTLTRFFALHGFILPGLLICLVVVHLYLFRRGGVTPPWWKSEAELKAKEEPFWPGQVLKDGVLILILLVGLGAWSFYRPAPLGALADPSKPYQARPEWYFMFMFAMLKHFPPPYEVVGTFVLPSAFFAILFFWPLLDRNPHRDPRKRPIAISLLALGSVGLVGLTVFAMATDVRMHEPELVTQKTPAMEPATPLQKLDVPDIYTNNCVACHGIDGKGEQLRVAMPTLPDFTSLVWQRQQSDEQMIAQIQNGKPPLMPAYKGKLTDEEIRWLTIYVRAFVLRPETLNTETATAPTTNP